MHSFGYLSNVLMHTMVAFKVPISHWLLFYHFIVLVSSILTTSFFLFLFFLFSSPLSAFAIVLSNFWGEGGCLLSLYFVNCLVIMSLLRFISGQEEGGCLNF